jgi:outer membrane protein W
MGPLKISDERRGIMRPRVLNIFAFTIALIYLLPYSSFGQDRQNYFALKGGIYSPTGDLDDADYDTGFNGEISYGRYFNPNFAMEIGAGYFKTDTSVSGFDPLVLGSFQEGDEIKVIPLTVTGKGIYPSGNFELSAQFGVGVYFADFEGVLTSSTLGTLRIDDDDTVLGVILGVGVSYNITSKAYLGMEARYLATDDVEIKGTVLGMPITLGGDLNGIMVTANLGFRF